LIDEDEPSSSARLMKIVIKPGSSSGLFDAELASESEEASLPFGATKL
jgi:hypothetical protein